jgi:hypothetical protein
MHGLDVRKKEYHHVDCYSVSKYSDSRAGFAILNVSKREMCSGKTKTEMKDGKYLDIYHNHISSTNHTVLIKEGFVEFHLPPQSGMLISTRWMEGSTEFPITQPSVRTKAKKPIPKPLIENPPNEDLIQRTAIIIKGTTNQTYIEGGDFNKTYCDTLPHEAGKRSPCSIAINGQFNGPYQYYNLDWIKLPRKQLMEFNINVDKDFGDFENSQLIDAYMACEDTNDGLFEFKAYQLTSDGTYEYETFEGNHQGQCGFVNVFEFNKKEPIMIKRAPKYKPVDESYSTVEMLIIHSFIAIFSSIFFIIFLKMLN